jgi:hypothetical protein
VGVAEQRHSTRLQRQHGLHRAYDQRLGLVRQAVHQVDVEAADAGTAEPRHGALGDFQRLPAVDGALHLGVHVLDTEARAVDP